MTIINLRDFYYWYTQDEYIEVTDDVAEALRASVRYEAAYTERARYNKAYYSLDADDGIEYLHDGEADKQNPVAVLGSPCCQDFISPKSIMAPAAAASSLVASRFSTRRPAGHARPVPPPA